MNLEPIKEELNKIREEYILKKKETKEQLYKYSKAIAPNVDKSHLTYIEAMLELKSLKKKKKALKKVIKLYTR